MDWQQMTEMEIKQTKKQGLSYDFQIIIKKLELTKQLDAEIVKLQPNAVLAGFRKGKVPLEILKKNMQDRVMQDLFQKIIKQAVDEITRKHSIKPADRPEITNLNEAGLKLEKDLVVELAINSLPNVPAVPIEKISLTRYKNKLAESDIKKMVAEQLSRLTEGLRETKSILDRQNAQKGDVAIIDFEGFIESNKGQWQTFQGGKANDFELELGSNRFIDGFETQVMGKKLGDEFEVKVTFPKHYQEESLSEKPAKFKVKLKALKQYKDMMFDDALAKKMGFETFQQLEDLIKKQVMADSERQTKDLLKRQLLDELHSLVDFELPPRMVESDFQAVFKEVKHAFEHEHLEPEDQGKDLKTLEKEYRAIAERRVKLGLMLNAIGEKAAIKVEEDEMRQAVMAKAMQYRPSDRDKFLKAVGNNPNLQIEISLPIFEQKTLDHILQQVKITDKELLPTEFIKKSEAIHQAPPK